MAGSKRNLQCPFGAHNYQDLALQIINFTLLENEHDEVEMEKQKTEGMLHWHMLCVHSPSYCFSRADFSQN
jgi:hypothetical protein